MNDEGMDLDLLAYLTSLVDLYKSVRHRFKRLDVRGVHVVVPVSAMRIRAVLAVTESHQRPSESHRLSVSLIFRRNAMNSDQLDDLDKLLDRASAHFHRQLQEVCRTLLQNITIAYNNGDIRVRNIIMHNIWPTLREKLQRTCRLGPHIKVFISHKLQWLSSWVIVVSDSPTGDRDTVLML